MNDEIVIANRAGARLAADRRASWARAEQELGDREDFVLPLENDAGDSRTAEVRVTSPAT